MNHHDLCARNCLMLARIFLACGIALLAGAAFIGPSWLAMVFAVVGVQSLNFSAAEYADRHRHLSRSSRCKH